MKYNVNAIISIHEEVDLEILDHSISPENTTMPTESGKVISKIFDGKFVTEINGTMSIGRLIHTLDDIIKTAILAKNVANNSTMD
ncbi:MAG: hypothetical protein ACW99A_01160 [Candidatus Kariarchaeaceae archaeon]|jgi:hypothetical protein